MLLPFSTFCEKQSFLYLSWAHLYMLYVGKTHCAQTHGLVGKMTQLLIVVFVYKHIKNSNEREPE